MLRYDFWSHSNSRVDQKWTKIKQTFTIDSAKNNFVALFGFHFQLKGLDDSLC